MDRITILNRIEEINKELGFVGMRGEQYFTDRKLKELLEELEEELKRRNK